jgi:hypothetical protein
MLYEFITINILFLKTFFHILVHNLWASGNPPPATSQPGSVYDLYDIYEEIGR